MVQAVMRPQAPSKPTKATVHGQSAPRGFALPSLVYTTLAIGFAVFLLGELFRLVQALRDVPELTMAAWADSLSHAGSLAAVAAFVFGGSFGAGLPGWARVALIATGMGAMVAITATHGAY